MPMRPQVTRLVRQWLTPKARLVKRSNATYIQQQGWKLTGFGPSARWDGWYRTRYGSYRGKIECSSPPKFFIYKPPQELSSHPHRACFSDRGSGWYSVHFSRLPTDLDSGVFTIERTLHESFRLSKKTA